MPPRPESPPAQPALVAALALGLLATLGLALLAGPKALFPELAALVRDVSGHDSETLRREHDGWYRRLLPAYAAVEALPADEVILLVTDDVPPWFVAGRFPQRRFFADSAALRAELDAQRLSFHVLTLSNGDPVGWTLEPGSAAPR